MLFPDDETWLSSFTKKYRTKKSVSQIGHHDLRKWAKLTANTGGRYLAKYMSPDLWGDSVESLQTAYTIIGLFAPAEIKESDASQTAWAALGRHIVRKLPKLKVKLQPRPKK